MSKMVVPDKLFFKIGEVCDIVGVEPYVLRFWETEFKFLSPEKAKSGHRLYRRKDVEVVLNIKELLYERGFTIAGARKQLALKGRLADQTQRERTVAKIQSGLREILALLERKT